MLQTKRARILIVEDDYFVAMEIEHCLSQKGFDVIGIAATLEEALQMATAEKPDIAIMDVRLAGARDGIDTALELRTKLDVPSLFATAHGSAETRKRGEAAKPLGWLQKPYTSDALLAAVNLALDKPN